MKKFCTHSIVRESKLRKRLPSAYRILPMILVAVCVVAGFLIYLLFTGEATFTQEGVFNVHKNHIWSTENPHAFLKRFSVNVWSVL